MGFGRNFLGPCAGGFGDLGLRVFECKASASAFGSKSGPKQLPILFCLFFFFFFFGGGGGRGLLLMIIVLYTPYSTY